MGSPDLNKPSTTQVEDLLRIYRDGNHALAEKNARVFTGMYPKHFLGWKVLGAILAQQNRPHDALPMLEQAATLNPQDGEVRSLLGLCFSMIGLNKQAEESLCKALKINGENAEFHNNLGLIRRKLRKFKDALKCFDRAIEIAPRYAGAVFNRATTLNDLGETAQAKLGYQKTLELNVKHGAAYRQLAYLSPLEPTSALYRQAHELFESPDLDQVSKIHLGFALARSNEKFSNFDVAFSYYKTANALQKSAHNYDLENDKLLFTKIKENHGLISSVSIGQVPATGITPVFVVGMPRSGTSLLEQILTSHTEIYGGGELNDIENLGFKLATGQQVADKENLLAFRNKYLERLTEFNFAGACITDKMPLNFRYIGLICAAFPEAKIVHIRRNPSAVCWSIYKEWFQALGMRFSCDLHDIVGYYHLYERLMAYWETSQGQRIFAVNYDELTTDRVVQTKSLIQYLGLPWEEACLRPENNTRSVSTASTNQVRRPVYTGSSERWRVYEPYLDGVLDNL